MWLPEVIGQVDGCQDLTFVHQIAQDFWEQSQYTVGAAHLEFKVILKLNTDCPLNTVCDTHA